MIIDAATALGLHVLGWPAAQKATDAEMVVFYLCIAVVNRARVREYLHRLARDHRLSRVFINEAYLAAQWTVLRRLLLVTRGLLADLPCPLVLTTATTTPRWTALLVLAIVGDPSRQISKIRAPSMRRAGVRYVVEAVPGDVVFFAPWGGGDGGGGGGANTSLHQAVAARVFSTIDGAR